MIFLTLLLICIFKPLPIFRSPLFLNLCQTNICSIIANGKEKCWHIRIKFAILHFRIWIDEMTLQYFLKIRISLCTIYLEKLVNVTGFLFTLKDSVIIIGTYVAASFSLQVVQKIVSSFDVVLVFFGPPFINGRLFQFVERTFSPVFWN